MAAVGVEETNGGVRMDASNDAERAKKIEQLNELMVNGRKMLLVDNADKAVDLLSDATRLADLVYGPFNSNCYAVNVLYGRALLEYACSLNMIVPVNEGEEEDSSDEDDEEGEGDAKEEEEEETTEKVDLNKTLTDEEAENIDIDEIEAEDEKTDSDSVSAILRTAFEILEIARIICEKKLAEDLNDDERKAWRLKLSDVENFLGSVYQSDEEHTKAKEEFLKALETKKELLPADDRQLAELQFQIGKVHFLLNEYAEGQPFFEAARKVIQMNIDRLSADQERDSKEKKEEIADLETVRAELDDHIKDAAESAAETLKMKKMLAETLEPLLVATVTDDQQEVNDCSNMVNRKRKSPPDSTTPNETKKPKVDEK